MDPAHHTTSSFIPSTYAICAERTGANHLAKRRSQKFHTFGTAWWIRSRFAIHFLARRESTKNTFAAYQGKMTSRKVVGRKSTENE